MTLKKIAAYIARIVKTLKQVLYRWGIGGFAFRVLKYSEPWMFVIGAANTGLAVFKIRILQAAATATE